MNSSPWTQLTLCRELSQINFGVHGPLSGHGDVRLGRKQTSARVGYRREADIPNLRNWLLEKSGHYGDARVRVPLVPEFLNAFVARIRERILQRLGHREV